MSLQKKNLDKGGWVELYPILFFGFLELCKVNNGFATMYL